MEALCNHYAPVDNPDRIMSSHALEWLADIGAEKPETKDTAIKALDLLSKTYDPIRTNYWNHRKVLLQKIAAA